MITLQAADAGGWALAQADDGTHWLIRPPYTQETRASLSAGQVERALESEDFVPESTPFESWGELCRELHRRLEAGSSEEERTLAKKAPDELLARSTPDQVRGNLPALESALRDGRSVQVRRAIVALLRSEAVRSDAELARRLLDLLTRCESAGRDALGLRAGQEAWTVNNESEVRRAVRTSGERGGILRPAA